MIVGKTRVMAKRGQVLPDELIADDDKTLQVQPATMFRQQKGAARQLAAPF
jgi:hypothetical protein